MSHYIKVLVINENYYISIYHKIIVCLGGRGNLNL